MDNSLSNSLILVSPNLYRQQLANYYETINLTPREVDVLACLMGARSTQKIAELLNLSLHTIRNHLSNIKLKVDGHSKEDIVKFIEDSGQYQSFRQHYLNLQIAPVFQQVVKDALSKNKTALSICLLAHKSIHESLALVINDLVEYFQKLGLSVISFQETHDKFEKVFLNSSLTHIIHLSIQEVSDHLVCEILRKHSFDFSKYIVIQDNSTCRKKIQANKHTLLCLPSGQNFFLKLVELLRVLMPEYDFLPFKQTCLNITGGETLKISVEPSASPMEKNYCKSIKTDGG